MYKEPTTRQLKVASEIRKCIAEIIRRRGMAAFGGAMVSVSGVTMSPDLSVAKVYVSVFPSDHAKEITEEMNTDVKMYRGELGRIIAKQFRIVPELIFYLDSSLDYVEHIERLLKK